MKVNKKAVKNIIEEIKPATLVAATKYVTIEEIRELEKQGVKIFGENRVQSLLEKYEEYQGTGEFHMIGTLQSNKVKYIIDKVTLIHSVDKISLLEEIQKQAKKQNIIMKILIQVNIANEESKHGFSREEVLPLFKILKQYPNVDVKGIMMMAPNESIEKIEEYFYQTRQLLLKIQKEIQNPSIDQISMGMSNDYHLAIKYGATYIRIGSKLLEKDI